MKLKLILFFVSITTFGFSQQEPQFTQFWNNYSLFNPANTAVDHFYAINSNYRTRFVDQGEQPQLISVNFEGKMPNLNSGIGGGYIFNKIGFAKSNKIYLTYAYHLKFKNESILSVGASADFQIMSFNPVWNAPQTGTQTVLDPSLPSTAKDYGVNINAGVMYKTKKLKLGLSLTQINEILLEKVNFKNTRHLFALASYKFGKGKFLYTPTISFKSNFQFSSIDFNNMFEYNKKIFLGFTYRHVDVFAFMLGYQFKFNKNQKTRINGMLSKTGVDALKLMYSYDINTGPLAPYGFNAHEISLIYVIDK